MAQFHCSMTYLRREGKLIKLPGTLVFRLRIMGFLERGSGPRIVPVLKILELLKCVALYADKFHNTESSRSTTNYTGK